jgi:hypothetical protein
MDQQQKNPDTVMEKNNVTIITLREWLKDAHSLDERYRIWAEIYQAIAHAYEKGIYYDDLHDRNVIMEKNHPIIIHSGSRNYFGEIVMCENLESALFLKLTQQIFPEHPISTLAEGNWKRIEPKYTVRCCQHWFELCRLKESLTARLASEQGTEKMQIEDAVFKMAVTVAEMPSFNADKLISWIKDIGIDNGILSWFARSVNDLLQKGMRSRAIPDPFIENSGVLIAKMKQLIGER